MFRLAAFLTALFGVVASPAIGQGASTNTAPTSQQARSGSSTGPFAGAIVAPKATLSVRSDPPGTFFQGKGDVIGMAPQGSTLRVLEEKTIPTITGQENWLRVQSTEQPSREGWIYNGTGSTPQNVGVVR